MSETKLSGEEDIVSWVVEEALVKHPTEAKKTKIEKQNLLRFLEQPGRSPTTK